jgi:hypothetical protein
MKNLKKHNIVQFRKRVEITCIICGKKKIAYPYAKTCSDRCRNKLFRIRKYTEYKKNLIWKNHWQKPLNKVNHCSICYSSKDVTMEKNYSILRQSFYCDHCLLIFKRKRRILKNEEF